MRIITLLLGFAAMLGLLPTRAAENPSLSLPLRIRVFTWNIHHGEGLDGNVNIPRIAALIQREKPDVVALQEVDRGVGRTQRRDLPAELAAGTGLTCVFSNNYHFDGGEYGNAILTRWPILAWTNTHFHMTRPVEQRGLLRVDLDLGGHPLTILNTHFDAQPNDTERLHESAQLLKILDRIDHKAIVVCGDFNAVPEHPVVTGLQTRLRDAWSMAGLGPGATVPVANPTRRIDYIWISNSPRWKVLDIEVLETTASDHLPVVADLEWWPEPNPRDHEIESP